MARLRIICLALLVSIALSGCNEEFLDSLNERQRALFLRFFSSQPSSVNLEPSEGDSIGNKEAPSAPFSFARLIEEDSCPELIESTPIGLSCLHCSHPKARRQAKLLATLMFRACVKNVATNFLIDGTFSYDGEFIKDVIELLNSNGRRLFVNFYLSNGATQRHWRSTGIRSFATQISPSEFRERIFYDASLRGQFKAIAVRAGKLVSHANSLGSVVFVTPALEDNLDKESFGEISALTLEALPAKAYFSLVRNPCPRCYPGNTVDVPEGFVGELHTAGSQFNLRDGIVSNDGDDYEFSPAEVLSGVTLDSLRETRDRAARQNNIFILWDAERQGIETQNGYNVFPHPNDRNYAIPSITERADIVSFLRGN
jgi:hypothetical protein